MKTPRVFRHAAFWLFGFACLLASCAAPPDLSAISAYANTTAQSADSFAALASDYAASCERAHRLSQGIVETSSAVQTATLVTKEPQRLDVFLISNQPAPGYTLPPAESAQSQSASSPASPQSTGITPVAQQTPNTGPCGTEQSVSAAWNNANGVVLDYVKALGNLAGVDAVPTPNPSPFVAGLSAAGVSSAATQAVSGLISSIASYFENQARDREIKSFLEAVNPNMPTAIGALEQVDYDYATHLQNEYTKTVTQYDAYVRLEVGSGTASSQTARRLLRTKSTVEAYLTSVNQKLHASTDYGSAVETILRTHEQLYAASQRNASFADYLKIVQTTGEPVVTNLISLAKAIK